jgi:DHA1 family tetracycline resistance protein-like MFS transporter
MNLLLVLFWLPESLSIERRAQIAQTGRAPFTLQAMTAALRRPVVGPMLHTRFFFGMAFSMFQSVFTLYAQYRFELTAQNTGYVLAYVGLLSVLTQGLLIGQITRRFSERGIILIATLVMAGGLLAWAVAPSIAVLLLVIAPIAVSGGVLNTILNASISKAVQPVEVGGILGVSSSLESLTRVIAPSLGGLLLQELGTPAPGIFAALLLFWLASYIFRRVLVTTGLPPAMQPSQETV